MKIPTVNCALNKRCVVEVFKCQNGLAPSLFKNYFKKILHQKEPVEITSIFCFQKYAHKVVESHSCFRDQNYITNYLLH